MSIHNTNTTPDHQDTPKTFVVPRFSFVNGNRAPFNGIGFCNVNMWKECVVGEEERDKAFKNIDDMIERCKNLENDRYKPPEFTVQVAHQREILEKLRNGEYDSKLPLKDIKES